MLTALSFLVTFAGAYAGGRAAGKAELAKLQARVGELAGEAARRALVAHEATCAARVEVTGSRPLRPTPTPS